MNRVKIDLDAARQLGGARLAEVMREIARSFGQRGVLVEVVVELY